MGHYWEAWLIQSALVCDHIQSLDEQMHVLLQEAFQYLFVMFLQSYELLLVTNLLGVQYQPNSRN